MLYTNIRWPSLSYLTLTRSSLRSTLESASSLSLFPNPNPRLREWVAERLLVSLPLDLGTNSSACLSVAMAKTCCRADTCASAESFLSDILCDNDLSHLDPIVCLSTLTQTRLTPQILSIRLYKSIRTPISKFSFSLPISDLRSQKAGKFERYAWKVRDRNYEATDWIL